MNTSSTLGHTTSSTCADLFVLSPGAALGHSITSYCLYFCGALLRCRRGVAHQGTAVGSFLLLTIPFVIFAFCILLLLLPLPRRKSDPGSLV